jgi:hypothetical protein
MLDSKQIEMYAELDSCKLRIMKISVTQAIRFCNLIGGSEEAHKALCQQLQQVKIAMGIRKHLQE